MRFHAISGDFNDYNLDFFKSHVRYELYRTERWVFHARRLITKLSANAKIEIVQDSEGLNKKS